MIHDIDLDEITPLPQPLFKPLPVSIIVHYDDDFSHYTATHQNSNHGVTSRINVGSFNTELLNYLLPHVFENVEFTQHTSSNVDDLGTVDFVIYPAVLAFDYWRTTNFDHVRVLYSLTFSLPWGEQVGLWELRAHNSIPVTGYTSRSTTDANIWKLSNSVARELSAKFIINICNQMFISQMSSPHCSDDLL